MLTQNHQGETPADVLARVSKSAVGGGAGPRGGHSHGDGRQIHWLPPKVRSKIIEGSKGSPRRNLLARIKENPKFREACMMVLPFFVFWGIGVTLDIEVDYLVKLFMFVCIYIVVNLSAMVTFDERYMPLIYIHFSCLCPVKSNYCRVMNFLPLGIYLSTKFWMYYTWFAYVSVFVSPFATVFFMTSSVGLWYNFLKSWKSDPGTVSHFNTNCRGAVYPSLLCSCRFAPARRSSTGQ